MSFDQGRLSVRLQNTPIGVVLEELKLRTRIRIVVAEELDHAEISADWIDVPLDLALRALLTNYDAFFYYGGASEEPATLRTVWVFPKGRGSTLQPVPPEAWVDSNEFEAVLADTDVRIRQQAYEALMRRPDSRRHEVVIQTIRGVREKDEGLRQSIFSAALNRDLSIPPEVLLDTARFDGSEQIRWMALDALSQHAIAKEAAEMALTDASSAVRQRASEILVELTAEMNRRKGVSRPPEQQDP
jgi:hypothetical protein